MSSATGETQPPAAAHVRHASLRIRAHARRAAVLVLLLAVPAWMGAQGLYCNWESTGHYDPDGSLPLGPRAAVLAMFAGIPAAVVAAICCLVWLAMTGHEQRAE